MPKIKYDKETFPIMAEGFARQGLNDEQIAEKLGIVTSTYYEYQKKYPELSEAIKRGKAPVDFEMENLLLKTARGFDYEETATEVKKESINLFDKRRRKILDETGQPVVAGEKTTQKVRKTTKKVPPSLGAIIFWVCNRMRHQWKQTSRIEIDSLPDEFQDVFKGMSTKRLEKLLDSDLTKIGKTPSKKRKTKKKTTPKKKTTAKKKKTTTKRKPTTPIKPNRRTNSKKVNKNRAGKT